MAGQARYRSSALLQVAAQALGQVNWHNNGPLAIVVLRSSELNLIDSSKAGHFGRQESIASPLCGILAD